MGDKVGPGLQIVNNEFGGGTIYHRSSLWTAASLAAEATAAPNCSGRLNVSVANRECQGLKEQQGATTLEACAAACCADAGCSVYQFCAAGGGCDGATGTDAQCWHGDMKACGGGTRHGWVGMGHGSPPPAVIDTLHAIGHPHHAKIGNCHRRL